MKEIELKNDEDEDDYAIYVEQKNNEATSNDMDVFSSFDKETNSETDYFKKYI